MSLLKFDEDELLGVAKVVLKHNDSLAGIEPAELVDMMKVRALNKPGYVGIHGYYLTTYAHPAGGLAVQATVAHWLFGEKVDDETAHAG